MIELIADFTCAMVHHLRLIFTRKVVVGILFQVDFPIERVILMLPFRRDVEYRFFSS
jgi:hypothetical protein